MSRARPPEAARRGADGTVAAVPRGSRRTRPDPPARPAEEAVCQEMRSSGRYRLTGSLPYRTSTGGGHFEIWIGQGGAGQGEGHD
ncbi:hypothetical protein [Streptomyces sp. NPDC002520]